MALGNLRRISGDDMGSLISKRELDKMSEKDRNDYMARHRIGELYWQKNKEISMKYNPEINRLKSLRDAEYKEVTKWRDELYEELGLNSWVN
jgi:hypothetical protein